MLSASRSPLRQKSRFFDFFTRSEIFLRLTDIAANYSQGLKDEIFDAFGHGMLFCRSILASAALSDGVAYRRQAHVAQADDADAVGMETGGKRGTDPEVSP